MVMCQGDVSLPQLAGSYFSKNYTTLHYITFPDFKIESTLWNARNIIILSPSATNRPFC